MASACVIGSGPNGLAAAITLAGAGVRTTVLERNQRLGGGCSTAEVTLPGFRHDLGSSAYPMGVASPLFRSLNLQIPWIEPAAPCAHPLDDGTAVMLEHSVEETAAGLDGSDAAAYRSLVGKTVENFEVLLEDFLGPLVHMPRHPLVLARFGLPALLPAATLARMRFKGVRARALLAGMAAHSVLPLEDATSAAVGLVLMAAGHAVGWPVLRGGGQALTDLLVRRLVALGGRVETGREAYRVGVAGAELSVLSKTAGTGNLGLRTDPCQLVMADVTPRQLVRMAGGVLPDSYRRKLEGFRYGAGAFKVDYALSEPIPWKARECLRAGTVHVCGTLEEVAESERSLTAERPFVLVVQPSLFDTERAPAGKHTAWAYCHVPNGSDADYLGKIEKQLERFAPGFRECVLARSVMAPAALERWNPNLVGGDLGAGSMAAGQLVFRPTASLYRTATKGLFLCGASTPPGGGVHGMAGFHAATMALRGRAGG